MDEQQYQDLWKKALANNAELNRLPMCSSLQHDDEIYVGGDGIFGKIDREGRLVTLLTQDSPKLPDGRGNSLFTFLFGGQIHNLEQTAEYPSFITFVSHNSGAISVYYDPREHAFYVAPRLVARAYKLAVDNTVEETTIPEFAKEDKELFDGLNDEYGILPKAAADYPPK